MPDTNKTDEFLQKLAPCIERGDLDACVEEAARLAGEMGIGAQELLELSTKAGKGEKYAFVYVLSLATAQDLEGKAKSGAYFNAGVAAGFIGKKEKQEQLYQLAIAANPNNEAAHSNYANRLMELNRKPEAEEQYKLAIAANPNYAPAHSNYANLLSELKRFEEAEQHYKLAIEADPKNAEAYYNYAILLSELKRFEEAEQRYKLAIEFYRLANEVSLKLVAAHSNYALMLSQLNRKPEAEEQYKLAIAANPNLAAAQGNYGLLLVEMDRREEAMDYIEKASDLFFRDGRVTDSHLAKAWFYKRLSEKNFNRKRFGESSIDANEAGEEYLKAASTADDYLKDDLTMQGNVLKAKSYVRKIPEKSWHKKILYRLGKNPDIPELIENLKNAAIYYERASVCPIGEKKNVCNACSFSMNVFSDSLNAMSAFINGDDSEINISKWSDSLEQAYKIYSEENLKKGIALVETLKQLIKCVNELAEHRKIGLHIQEEKLGKCLNNLIEVSDKMEGALKVIAEHSAEAIREYAKKQGMGFVKGENFNISYWDMPSRKALLAYATIIAVIIAILQFAKLDTQALEYVKSLFSNSSVP